MLSFYNTIWINQIYLLNNCNYLYLLNVILFVLLIQLIYICRKHEIFFNLIKTIQRFINIFFTNVLNKFLQKSMFIDTFYKRNELIWLDGFLFDFLQKKSIDLWIRKYLIYTYFLFSERLFFDSIINLYLNNLIWPLHKINLFELSNISEVLNLIIFLYFTLILLFSGYFFFILI